MHTSFIYVEDSLSVFGYEANDDIEAEEVENGIPDFRTANTILQTRTLVYTPQEE